MRKLLFAFIITTAIAACGGKKGSTVSSSPEMESFMKMLDGKSSTVETALGKYGSEGLNKADMDLYDLKDPKVVATNGNCYTMEAKSGITTRTYDLCWESGKIKSVTDKGMK